MSYGVVFETVNNRFRVGLFRQLHGLLDNEVYRNVSFIMNVCSGVFRMCERRGPRGSGDGSLPVGPRGKAQVRGLGDEVPQELTLFC